MDVLLDMFQWFADPRSWSGSGSIPRRLLEHLWLSAVPLGAAIAVAIPTGVLAGHYRRGHAIGAAVANVGRAIPTLALLVFGLLLSIRVLDWGFRFWPTVFALFLLALHPMFTNAYTAVREVEPSLVEAARGQGLDERQVLRDVELPVASPVIMTAVRVSAVQVVATAPLGALASEGGLGRFIIDGFQQFDYGEMLGGVVIVALLAVAVEQAIGVLERRIVPEGIRRRAKLADVAAAGRAA